MARSLAIRDASGFSIRELKVLRCYFRLVGLLLMLCFGAYIEAAENFATVYISEFLAENQQGMKDNDNDRPGWIELYNGGNRAVNLAGWFLTDNATNLARWRFPGVVLLPDKYLLVYASAKDRTKDLNHLHTNFRLTKQGGYLALVNPATNVVSEFNPYPKQSADVSFGRVRGEPALVGPFSKPTPDRSNASSGPGFAPSVAFSKSAGNFLEPFQVELSCGSTGAVIRYTRDGTMPTRESPLYDAPLAITNSTHLRARAFSPGLLPGPPASAAYTRLSTGVPEFTSTLPVLVMNTFGMHTPVSSQDRFVHLTLYEPVNGKTSLTNAPTLTTRAGFHVRGSTSSGFPQSPFSVELLDEFNEERALSLLGMPADSDWVLYAPNPYDPIMIHNPFIHQLSRDMGRYSPRTRFIEVFLAKSAGSLREAQYYGVYVLTEKIKIGKHRINIDKAGGNDLTPPKVTGGYVLKYDRLGPGEVGVWASGDRGLVYVEPREEMMRLPQRAAQPEYVMGFMRDFSRALLGQDWKDPLKGYRAYFDVDAAIDFHVLEVLSGNVDAMVLSTYFYKPRKGKITCGPHWDFDRALGSIDERDAEPRRWSTGPFFEGEWWPRLFRDPDFWQQWVDRWQDLRENHFSLTNLHGLIDRLCAEVREAQPREYRKWGLQPRGGSYQGEIDHMKNWLSNRLDFIDQQLAQPPRPAQSGAVLTLAAATKATIYYTLDGSDPRASQGRIASNAVVYTAPIQLPAGAQVVARVRDTNEVQRGGPPISTPWSKPVRIGGTSRAQ
jgi:hypothetical protein